MMLAVCLCYINKFNSINLKIFAYRILTIAIKQQTLTQCQIMVIITQVAYRILTIALKLLPPMKLINFNTI